MKRIKFGLLIVLISITLPAAAKHPVTFEWGAIVGVNVPNYSAKMSVADVRNKLGWQAGIVTSVDFGIVGINPQILYNSQGLRLRPQGADDTFSVKSHSVDVPILLSLRALKILRIYAGPVITVMNDCGGDVVGQIRPTCSYAAGASVKLRHFLVDLRYNGQFVGKKNIELPDNLRIDKLRSNAVALSVGLVF